MLLDREGRTYFTLRPRMKIRRFKSTQPQHHEPTNEAQMFKPSFPHNSHSKCKQSGHIIAQKLQALILHTAVLFAGMSRVVASSPLEEVRVMEWHNHSQVDSDARRMSSAGHHFKSHTKKQNVRVSSLRGFFCFVFVDFCSGLQL